MNKYILPMMLSLLSINGLTSINNVQLEQNKKEVSIKKVNNSTILHQHKVTNFLNGEIKNIINSSPIKLNLPTTKFTPKTYEDFEGKQEFDYMGFKYSVTDADSTVTIERKDLASNATTLTEVYYGEIEGGDTFTSSYNSCKSFTSVKTIYGSDKYVASMKNLQKLDTIVTTTNETFTFEGAVNTSFKNLLFTSSLEAISGLEYCHDNVRFIAPVSIAINVKNALDEAYDLNPDALSNRPVLYVIPDESSVMELYEEYPAYEFGGLYFARKDNTSQYQLSNIGQYVTKAVFDTSYIESEEYDVTYTNLKDTTHIDELYYIQPTSSSDNFLGEISIDKLYLKETPTSFYASYYENCKEVYLPATEYGVVGVVGASELEDTQFYIPEGYDDKYEVLKTNSDLVGKIHYYDASKYIPSIEINYKGEVISTTDLTISSRTLLSQVIEEETNNDSLTNEEQEKFEEDKKIASEVSLLIDSLIDITIDSKDAIIKAKEAFEELTYDQQQLVDNYDKLQNAIDEYNDLVIEYNKTLNENDKPLELIEDLHIKNKFDAFKEEIKTNKVMRSVTVVVGTVLGLLFLYGLYKIISKVIKWLKK